MKIWALSSSLGSQDETKTKIQAKKQPNNENSAPIDG